MKRLFFFLLISLSGFVVKAQTTESIKTKMVLRQYKEAKEDLDKAMTNAKFSAKPESYIQKTTIYATLAMDDAIKSTPAAEQLMTEAAAAFSKYKELDPAMSMIDDPLYRDGPVNLYASFFTAGAKEYEAKKWQASFERFKKAVELADLLISKKMLSTTFDTTAVIYAGYAAQNSNNKDDAAKYYLRIVDQKISGKDFEDPYRFLVGYYFGKKDIPNFEKYKALGQQLYPNSEYFKFDKIDFAVGLEENFDSKIKALEEMLATNPNDYKANELLGEFIYGAFYPYKDDKAIIFDTAALEPKMINAFTKAGIAQPDSIDAFLFLGDHFIKQSVKVNEQREAHAADMKSRTKPGTMASKEDIAKRDLLDKQYGDALEKTRAPYERAAEIFAAKPNLSMKEKQQYRNLVGYLTDIYAFKKSMAKGKPAEQAKYAAEEKKWNDRYESIK